MNTRRVMRVESVFAASALLLSAQADVAFSDATQKYLTADATYTAVTTKQTAFPTDVGTPIFWLDCAATNGWTISADGGVLKLPSKVSGSTRYLTSDKSDPNFENFSWKFWGWPSDVAAKRQHWVQSPTLTSPEDGLAGHGVLDFGALGSERGLVFDLWRPDETCAPSNALANIGSVFAVYDSTNGGGLFLGGGYGKNQTGYGWHRGYNSVDGDAKKHFYCDPLFVGHAFDAVYYGTMRHFGLPAANCYVGFGGGWEALTLCPKDGVATQDATGLGLGDIRASVWGCDGSPGPTLSGGMRIAEMIFFDRVLSTDEALKVEAYLRTKWLSTPAGWNGNAVLSAVSMASKTDHPGANGVRLTVNADAGETATLTTVSGGHFDSAFVKTGAGTLAFGAAPNFNTPLDVQEGTLSFARRTVPTNVPTNYAFRLDASQGDLITKDADNNVSRIDNFGGHQVSAYDLYLTTPYAQPKYLPDALGAGKPVLDLGAVSDTGAFLKFTTDKNTSATVNVPGVCAIVAVVGAQEGGGSLAASKYLYRVSPRNKFGSGLLSTGSGGSYCMTFVDGVRRDPEKGYPTPGYHVVALQTPSVNYEGLLGFGAAYDSTSGLHDFGGLRIAEAIAYDRILSEEELRDASAYLMNKWFGRVPGDYQIPSPTLGSVELQKLKLAEGTVVDVPAGCVAKVGRLDLLYPAAKTGEGTLVVQESAEARNLLTVRAGKVLFEAAPDVTEADELAAGASFRLDASDASLMETVSEGGTNFLLRAYSPGFGNLAYAPTGRRPWISATETLSGKPTIEFGPIGATKTDGNCLAIGKALRSVRSVYVVWRPHSINTWMLGMSTLSDGLSDTNYDYHRGGNGALFRNDLFATICTNGAAATRSTVIPTDEWILVEAHTQADDSGGLCFSALGTDRDWGGTTATTFYGGLGLAEVVAFERELSAREKVATRNYLLKKWFPSVARAELPAAPDAAETSVAAIDVGDASAQSVASGETLAVGRLTGSGTLAKTGAGTLAVRDLADFTGAVDVQAGVLKLTGEPTTDEPTTNGLVYHADSQWGVTTETTPEGVKKVVSWKSKMNDGWAAVPPISWGDSKPRYLENALNGKAVVDLALPTDTNTLQCLRFQKDGVDAQLTGLKSALWVIGSQNGGGYLLGGGKTERDWQRIGNYTTRATKAADRILYGGALNVIRWGNWYVNDVKLDNPSDNTPDGSLSGSWDLVCWDVAVDSRDTASADGFGFDGSILTSPWSNTNGWRVTGQQRLAEVLVYDRILSADERETASNYLKAKWGLTGLRRAVTNRASVILSDGATLDLDGKDQYLGTLGGTGTIVNGADTTLTLGAIAFDCASDACLSIPATVAIPSGFTVRFSNFPENGEAAVWKIADVAGFENQSGTSRVALTGVSETLKARLRSRDGGLYVEFSKGLFLLVR